MRHYPLIAASILWCAAAASAQTVEWSDWYEDPKVPGIALRSRCDPAVKETQVEIKNLTNNQMWWFVSANKLIKGYKGSEYELYPGQTVQIARDTKDCQRPSPLSLQAGVDLVNAIGQAEYLSAQWQYWDHMTMKEGKFSMLRFPSRQKPNGYASSYKHNRSWFRPCTGSTASEPEYSLKGPTPESTPSGGGASSALISGTQKGSQETPAGERETSLRGNIPQSVAQGYIPRSECIMISTWWRIGSDGHNALAKNTCNSKLYVRACILFRIPTPFTCVDGVLRFGESMFIGSDLPPGNRETCETKPHAWAAEGGEAAKRWVQSHRPETTQGCGDPQLSAQPEKPQ